MTTYDPKYSTQVAFNTPIMISILMERDLEKVKDWFDHGEPHKKLATAALEQFLQMQWVEALDLLWQKDWLTQKGMITIACNYMVSYTNYNRQPEFIGSASEQWIFDKVHSNILSKAQKNSLFLSLLSFCQGSNPHYWDVFYHDELVFKGKTSEEILGRFIYSLTQQNNEYHNYDDEKVVALKQLETVLSNKNGFEISYFDLTGLLVNYKYQNFELFFKIIESNKMIMNQKDLFTLAVQTAIFFRSVVAHFKNYEIYRDENPNFADESLMRAIKAYIKAGLPEKITYSKKDLEDRYLPFDNGYFSISNYSYGNDMRYQARQFPYIYHGYHAIQSNKIIDREFYTGVALFSELGSSERSSYDKTFKVPNDNEFKSMVDKFSILRQEVIS